MPGLKQFLQKHYVDPELWLENLIKSSDTEQETQADQENKDQLWILTVKEWLQGSLLSIAS